MKYCSSCGQNVSLKMPEGDNRHRFVCDDCGTIHYQNPNMVTGCIPEWEDKILLCRRAIEPRHGYWTLPAGFMENRETADQGAARETLEEACAHVQIDQLYTLFNLPHISQVYLIYRGQLLNQDFAPGEESLEVKLFSEDEIPWDELAFQVVHETLKLYFKDRVAGGFTTRSGTIERLSDSPRHYRTALLSGNDKAK
ncbi:MAG: NUDIX hydrolase [Gammaproteobacteria bacterium]|nr:NUDIX hydrolase [Gammaproteobacteria bacterium]